MPIRVYDAARVLGVSEPEALVLLRRAGAPVRNRLSVVDPAAMALVEEQLSTMPVTELLQHAKSQPDAQATESEQPAVASVAPRAPDGAVEAARLSREQADAARDRATEAAAEAVAALNSVLAGSGQSAYVNRYPFRDAKDATLVKPLSPIDQASATINVRDAVERAATPADRALGTLASELRWQAARASDRIVDFFVQTSDLRDAMSTPERKLHLVVPKKSSPMTEAADKLTCPTCGRPGLDRSRCKACRDNRWGKVQKVVAVIGIAAIGVLAKFLGGNSSGGES